MKLKKRWKKWIAFILVFALSLSSIPVSQVQAETNATENSKDVITSIMTSAEHEVEKDLEARNDSKSKNPAGNWYVAIHIDQLAWNFFHNKVQEDINNRYSNVDTEIQIKNKYNDGKPTGKPGRADIGMILDDKTYLWEVKPMSYSIDPEKKESAIKQLNGYVDSSSEFGKGSNQITDGTVTYNITRVRSDYIEDITYTIDYYVQDNGLIFYKFNRSSKKRETEKEKEKYPIAMEEKDKAIEDVTSVKVPVKNTEETIRWTPVQLATVLAFAKGWKKVNVLINSNPETNNSASTSIIQGCTPLIVIVTAAIMNPEQVNAAEVNNAIDDFETLFWVFNGDDYATRFIKALDDNDEETINELLKLIQEESDTYEEAGEIQPPRDPLVIDLGEKGIKLHNVKNGVNFDLDNNGFAEKTGQSFFLWV